MLRRSVVRAATVLSLLLGAAPHALADGATSVCSAVREHSHDTVIVFQPPAAFTVCRDGKVEPGVVTDRAVYLDLVPSPGPRMFDFRIHGKSSDWTPQGLGAWETLTTSISSKLRVLDHSGEPIAKLVIPTEVPAASTAAPLHPLIAARTRYLAEVTPEYLEALHSVHADARELPVVAGVVRRWCAALAAQPPGTVTAEAELQASCAAPELREGAVEKALQDFEAAVQKASAERNRAREATLAAIEHPEDAKIVADGARALDDARVAATAVVTAGHALRASSTLLSRAVGTLRVSLRSVDALKAGVPTYIATYGTAGNAELEIDAIPSDIAASGADMHVPNAKATARYPIFGRHYFDIEAGIGWAAGVPDSLYLTTTNGAQVIQTQPVEAVVGLALFELEPMRFLWPERSVAGILRFPVVGIPFTRDPTSNFFFGAGVGWTGVGSISAGPYVIRETMLRQGFTAYETLPSNVPFDAVTYAGAGVGYFVSASVDLVGLFHLFVPSHAPAIDGLTGKEVK